MSTNKRDSKTFVVTGKIRMSYAHLFKPKAISEGQEAKYSLCVLIPKSDKETLRKIKTATDAAKEAGKSMWGNKIPPNLKTPLHDGDVDRSDQEEYAGHYFLNANSKQKPGIVDKYREPVLDESEVYSGCYGKVSLNFFPYNSAGNKGVGCGLNNVQKLADGEPLGGRTRPEDDFDIEDAGDDDFLS